MARTLRIIVRTGAHRNKKYCLRGPMDCMVGTGGDCYIQFDGSERDRFTSLHHARLMVDANSCKVQDLGSQNGTFLDGEKIETAEVRFPDGGSCQHLSEEENGFFGRSLLTVGGTTLALDVVDCPLMDKSGLRSDEGKAIRNCPVHCEF